MAELTELLVPDAAQWHDWLHDHRADHPGVWLVLRKKGGLTTTLTYAEALDEAPCFGWIDGQLARRDDDSYRQRFTPRRATSQWSARNVEHVNRLAAAGRMHPAANPVAAATFAGLNASDRYSIVYRLNAVQREGTRQRKLADYIDLLNRGEAVRPRQQRSESPSTT